MKDYVKPTIEEEAIQIEDVIAESFGTTQAGDKVVDFFGN